MNSQTSATSISKPNPMHFIMQQGPSAFKEKKTVIIGSLIHLGYLVSEGNKERTQFVEGVVIAKQNRGIGQTFTIRRTVQGIGVEQVFFFHSPKIKSFVEKKRYHVRRAKLYFYRSLRGKLIAKL